MRNGLMVVVTAAALAISGAASAETESVDLAAEARASYQQGVAFFQAGQFEQSAIAFERAYELRPHFKILWNLAEVENELQHFAAAYVAYTRYLAEGGDDVPAERRAKAQDELARLGALVGTLTVHGAADEEILFVDGKRKGELPLAGPVYLDLGEHEITLRREGAEVHREIVRIAGGRLVEIDLGSRGGAAEEDPGDAQERRWTWVALGIGGAAGIAGGVLGGIALAEKSELEGRCVGSRCPPSAEADAQRLETLALSADVLFGVAAVGVAAAVVLFFVEPDASRESGLQVSPAVSAEAAGLRLAGRFSL